jgi:hypothetical protein
LDELQSFVGGYIEHIGSNYLQIWLNEEGKLENRPLNRRATRAAHIRHIIEPGDVIVGDVLLQASAQHGRANLAVLLNTPLPVSRPLPSNGQERLTQLLSAWRKPSAAELSHPG